MNRIGIDWVSAGIFVVAYVVSQIRSIPVRPRYVIVALAFGAIASYRLHGGPMGLNLLIAVAAAAAAVYYLYRAFSARPR